MKTFKGILAAIVLCAALVPGFAPASVAKPLQPDELAAKCTSNAQCYAVCGEFGGRCIFGTCYCY
jgi:hypothetical protein